MPTTIARLLQRHVAVAASLCALAACGGGGEPEAPPAEASDAAGPAASADDDGATRRRALTLPPNPWMNENNVVVQLKPGEDIAAVASLVGGTVIDRLDSRPIHLLSAKDPKTAPGTVMQSGMAIFSELNGPVWSPEHDSEAIKNSVSAIGGLDPNLYPRWAETDLRLAELQYRGRGVTVAVLDTGMDLTHPELKAKRAARRIDFVAPDDSPWDEAPPIGRRFRVEDGADWAYGHGTHVAGVIARAAPDAKIMPVRVLDTNGRGTLWVVAKGIVWAIDPDKKFDTDDGAAVLNMSFGTPDRAETLRSVIEIAGCGPALMSSDRIRGFDDRGFDADRIRCGKRYEAVLVAGAGNDPKTRPRLYPAAYADRADRPLRGLVSVTATAEHRKFPPFANRHSSVTIGAPGDRITSTFPPDSVATMSGTSMAAPWVSATAALVFSSLPPGGDPTRPTLRQWTIDKVIGRFTSLPLTTPMCTLSAIRQINPVAAVTGIPQTPPICL